MEKVFLTIFFFPFRELVISCLEGCCNDSLSRSKKVGDSSEKMHGLESRERKKGT